VAAIDLGTSKTATAIAEIGDVRGLYIESMSSVPTEGMVKGVVRDLNAVGMSIYQSFSQAAHTVGDVPEEVYLSVSGGSMESYDFSTTKTLAGDNEEVTEETVEELRDKLRETKVRDGFRLIDVVPQNYTLDGIENILNPVGMFGKNLTLNAHIVIGPESQVLNLERAVERTGLKICGLVPAVLGSAYSVMKEEESRGGVLIVDFGAGTTDLAVLVDGLLRYISILPVGGNHFDNDLRQGLGISIEEASRLKLNYGRIRIDPDNGATGEFVDIKRLGKRDYEKIPKQEIYRILEPRFEELIELIWQNVKSSGFKDDIAGGAILVGGGALSRGFRAALSMRIGVNVRVGYPEGFNHLLEEYRTPSYTAVLGMLRYASMQPVHEAEGPGLLGYLRAGWDFIQRQIAAKTAKGAKTEAKK